MMALTTTNIFI